MAKPAFYEETQVVKQRKDEIIRLEPWRKVVAEGFAVAQKPDVALVWLQDMLPAMKFRDRYRRENRFPLTYTPLLIRACALSLRKYQLCNSHLRRGSLVIPSTIDIGIPVAGAGVLDPVVVIRESDTKSLREIVQEMRQQSRDVKEQQQSEQEKLNRLGRWLPSIIRRKVIAWAVRNQVLRRRYIGTFQISVWVNPFVPAIDFAYASFISTSFMMVVHPVAKRPVVVEDKLEIRPTSYITLMGDHSVGERTHTAGFITEFQDLLLNPEKLDS